MLKQAYSFIDIGDKKTGKVILERVIEKYSQSAEAELAEKKIAEILHSKKKPTNCSAQLKARVACFIPAVSWANWSTAMQSSPRQLNCSPKSAKWNRPSGRSLCSKRARTARPCSATARLAGDNATNRCAFGNPPLRLAERCRYPQQALIESRAGKSVHVQLQDLPATLSRVFSGDRYRGPKPRSQNENGR